MLGLWFPGCFGLVWGWCNIGLRGVGLEVGVRVGWLDWCGWLLVGLVVLFVGWRD